METMVDRIENAAPIHYSLAVVAVLVVGGLIYYAIRSSTGESLIRSYC